MERLLKKMPKPVSSHKLVCGMVFIVLTACILNAHYSEFLDSDQHVRSQVLPDTDGWKKIYIMTPYLKRIDTWEKIFRRLISSQCRESRCILVSNPDELLDSDAVVLSGADLPSFQKLNNLIEEKRSSNQYWVYFNMNPPTYQNLNVDLRKYNSFFNWTMTYRSDSDIISPYGLVIPKNGSSIHHLSQELEEGDNNFWKQKKSKILISFMATCTTPSLRENYLKKLRKYIDVHVFGECGNPSDKRKVSILSSSYPTYLDVAEEYIPTAYFYFAIENSLCSDYITEAFYRALKLGTIPIVQGTSANYSRYAPPNSYVDVEDFYSPKHLAEHLRDVINNSTLYESYHKWRENYIVKLGYPYDTLSCGLCAKLHEKNGQSIIKEFSKWRSKESCKSRNILV